MSHYLNPKRLNSKRSYYKNLIFIITSFIIKRLLLLGFKNIDYYYVHGEGNGNKVILGKNVSTMDATFNVTCGNITILDNTLLSHDVHLLTGFHRFHEGVLAKQSKKINAPREVPTSGYDIIIGKGCFIGSRVTILKSVTLGDNVIVAAGSVVTKSFPNNVFIAGIPAKIIRINI